MLSAACWKQFHRCLLVHSFTRSFVRAAFALLPRVLGFRATRWGGACVGSSGLAEVVAGSPGHLCEDGGEARRVGPGVPWEQAGAPSGRRRGVGAEGAVGAGPWPGWLEKVASAWPPQAAPLLGVGFPPGASSLPPSLWAQSPPLPQASRCRSPGPGKPGLCGPGGSLRGCLRPLLAGIPLGVRAAGWVRLLRAPEPGGEDGDAGEGPLAQVLGLCLYPPLVSLSAPSLISPSSLLPFQNLLDPSPCCLRWSGWGRADTVPGPAAPLGWSFSPRGDPGATDPGPVAPVRERKAGRGCRERQEASGGVGLPPRPT